MPVKPGGTPLAPTGVSKSGTSVIKAAPPKETARITVKPSLPGTATPKPAAIPTVKPAAGAPVAAMAAGAAAGVAAVKATEAKPKAAAAPVATKAIAYEEPAANTLFSTIAAGVCCLVTWGTAAVLAYFCFSS